MQEGDGHGDAALGARLGQGLPHLAFVQGRDHLACGVQALGHLGGHGVKGFGPHDVQGEEIGPCLVSEAQGVTEAPGGQEQGRRAAALQQRIGRHRRAHADGADLIGRKGGARFCVQHPAHGLHGGVRIGVRRRQELERTDLAVVPAGDHICERAAPIDPEAPKPVQNLTRPMLVWRCHQDAFFLRLVALDQ